MRRFDHDHGVRRRGEDISEARRPEISEEEALHEEIRRSRAKALDLLKFSDRSENELRRKLRERGFSDAAVDDAITYAYSFHYLDDARLAESFIRSRRGTLSTIVIRRKLMEKGISSDVIDEAFSRADEDSDGITDDDDADITAAVAALRKKLRSTDSFDSDDGVGGQKLLAYMYRKGFSPEVTRRALQILRDEV